MLKIERIVKELTKKDGSKIFLNQVRIYDDISQKELILNEPYNELEKEGFNLRVDIMIKNQDKTM